MSNPENLMYSKTHEWVDFISETTARIGLTDYAQEALGGIVFIDLPEAGDALTSGMRLGDVESVKTVSEITSPISGIVDAVNEEVLESPEKINEEPYDAWLVEVSGITSRVELLDAAEYGTFCDEN